MLTYHPMLFSFSPSLSVSFFFWPVWHRAVWCDFSQLWSHCFTLAGSRKRPWGIRAGPATSGSRSAQQDHTRPGSAQNGPRMPLLFLTSRWRRDFRKWVRLRDPREAAVCVAVVEVDGHSLKRLSVWCESSFREMFVWCDIAACSSACGGCEGWLRARHRRTLLDKRNMLPATSSVWSQLCVSYLILEPKGRITSCVKKNLDNSAIKMLWVLICVIPQSPCLCLSKKWMSAYLEPVLHTQVVFPVWAASCVSLPFL